MKGGTPEMSAAVKGGTPEMSAEVKGGTPQTTAAVSADEAIREAAARIVAAGPSRPGWAATRSTSR